MPFCIPSVADLPGQGHLEAEPQARGYGRPASPSGRNCRGTRRLAKRSCGNCGQPAEAMLPWGGLQVAICATCQARLNGPEPRTPWCAFNEIYPMDLRDQVPTAGVRIEARLMPAVELPPQRRSLAGRFLGALGRMLRPGSARGTRTAITGK